MLHPVSSQENAVGEVQDHGRWPPVASVSGRCCLLTSGFYFSGQPPSFLMKTDSGVHCAFNSWPASAQDGCEDN